MRSLVWPTQHRKLCWIHQKSNINILPVLLQLMMTLLAYSSAFLANSLALLACDSKWICSSTVDCGLIGVPVGGVNSQQQLRSFSLNANYKLPIANYIHAKCSMLYRLFSFFRFVRHSQLAGLKCSVISFS